MKEVNTKLTRDQRYIDAQTRLTELKTERDALDRQRDEAQTGLSKYPSASDLLSREAAELLDGPTEPTIRRGEFLKTLEQTTHRLHVVREAIEIQRRRISDITQEVSKVICLELEPEHRLRVSEVAAAVLELAKAVQREWDLREELNMNGVQYSAVLRPMTLPGFLLTDPNGAAARYLIDAAQHNYIPVNSLPDAYRKWLPPVQKASGRKGPDRQPVSTDGWAAA